MKRFTSVIALFLLLAMVLSLFPAPVVKAESMTKERTEIKAVSVSSVSVPAYSGGKSSGWMTYDCGQHFAMGNTGNQSKMMIVTGTTSGQFLSYGDTLKSKGYTVLYEKKVAAQTDYNRHYKFLSPDGTYSVYTYFVEAYKETRIIVDTNVDSLRSFSYKGSGNNIYRTELYAVPFSASEDGFLYSSDYGSQNRNNAGAMYIIRMSDNSLFVIDGGSYIQMSDRDCERIYKLMRRITGLPEGQKMVINTWFVTHYHDDHVSGFSRFLSKYHTELDLLNVMYNFDVVGASGDNTEIVAKIYPNAKYYKPHTGESFMVCDAKFDVLYTVEDLYTPNSSNNLVAGDAGCMRKSNEENNCSAVLRLTMGGKTVLLTGDIYDGDRILISMYPAADLHADVLQIPHHGFDGHVTLVKAVMPGISIINQKESSMGNRKSNYTNNRGWAPYAGTIYYGNSELIGYCAESGIFLREPFTEDVDWLSWGNLTREMDEANAYTSSTVTDSEKYYRYDRVTTAPAKFDGTYMIVDDKMGYPLSYNTSSGAIGNATTSFYTSNDRFYFGASMRRDVNWNLTASPISDISLAAVDGGKGYYYSGAVKKGSGDYWGTNSKNYHMALGKNDTFEASGMFSSWCAFTNQMEASTNSVRLDMMQDNTFLLYARYNVDTPYRPLYRDPSLTTTKGWGVAALTKAALNDKVDYLNLRLYSYNPTADTLLLSWTGHKDYYADPGISKSQVLSLLTADLRVKYQFKSSGDSGEIFYDGWQNNAIGTYWLEFPSGYSGSTAGNYTINIKFKNHAGTTLSLGSFTLHIRNRSNDPATKQLFFDFNDDTDSRRNYRNESQYNGVNFDGSSRWEYIEYNASTKTNDITKGFVDTLAGTLTLYTKTPDTARKNLSIRTYASGYNPLSYSPKNAEVVQIRYKAENLKSASDGTANFRLCYYKDGGTELAYESTYNLDASSLTDGKYRVVTVALSDTFRNCASITGLRPAFSYVIPKDTSKAGSVTIDYLYIGPKANAPVQEERNLFFDFTNNTAAQTRYTAEQYNGRNFDRENRPNWSTSETSTTAKIYNDCTISNAEGVLKVNVAEDLAYGTTNSYYGPWLVSSGPTEYFVDRDNRQFHALGFEPQPGDVVQLRFKLEGCVSATGSAPRVVVVYDRTNDGVSTRGSYNLVANYTLQNGVYQVISIPVNSEFANADVITNIGFRFWDIKAESKGSGKVVVDYIYVGAPANAPAMSYTVNFTLEDGTVLYSQEVAPGGTVSYGGQTPTKAGDSQYHYLFSGWDKPLNNIQSNTTFIAQFTPVAHSFTYGKQNDTNHEGICSCGYKVSLKHSWDAGEVTKEADCTAEGTMVYTCTVCKCTKTEAVDPKGHTPVTDQAVAPTCTETGLTEGTHCSVCNAVLTAQEVIPATGHSYDSGVITTQPTCTEKGVKTYTCTVCKASKTETVDPWGHTPVTDEAVAPTCTEVGMTEGKHCSVCNAVLTAQEVIPATGHSYAYEKIDVLTHRVYCSNCDAEEITSHVFIDGSCICGEVEIKDPVLDSSLKLSHSLNLASDISINFVVPAYLLEGYDMSTVYVESTVENYEGETFLGTETLRIAPVLNGSLYYFTLTGITAVQMNDTISTVLYGEKDGQLHYSNTDLYSVAQYAYSQLNKPNSTGTLKTLCADLLRYGAKAQLYKEYRVSALADGDMTEEHKSYLSDLEAVTFGNNSTDLGDLANAPISWVGKTLDLDSKVCLKFVFNVSKYKGELSDLNLKVSYKDIYGETMEVTVTEATEYDAARYFYAFSVDALLASELREIVSVQIFEGENPVSSTFQYSADTYGNNKTGTLLELCKALFAYSDSAKAYFAN